MNNELISRDALNETIDKITWYHINSDGELVEGAHDDGDALYKAEDIYKAIDNAPTVDTTCPHCDSGYAQGYSDGYLRGKEESPQGGWIPVCERLPEYTGLYLISIYDLVTVANFTGKHFCDRQMDNFVDVIAWQPLPEPYKKGGAE